MNNLPNGHLPILGQPTPRVTGNAAVFVRRLDDDGAVEAGIVVNTAEGPLGAFSRLQYLDAEELIEEIRLAVRAEIRAELHGFKRSQSLGVIPASANAIESVDAG